MGKFKICPVCGKHNKPNMVECFGCETDLTSVKATDENEIHTENSVKQEMNLQVQQKYVRICDCGYINGATDKICKECGEDISDIAPITLAEETSSCKFILASLDGSYAYEICCEDIVIGREHEMKEYLSDKAYVSRKHARILKKEDKIYIENLSETNFTFVNNKKISEVTVLNNEDEVGLGGNEQEGKRQEQAAYFVMRNI